MGALFHVTGLSPWQGPGLVLTRCCLQNGGQSADPSPRRSPPFAWNQRALWERIGTQPTADTRRAQTCVLGRDARGGQTAGSDNGNPEGEPARVQKRGVRTD